MELALLLYAASIAENIKGVLTPFVWIFGILAIVSAIAAVVTAFHMEQDDEDLFTIAQQLNEYSAPKNYKEETFQSARKASKFCRRASIWLIVAWFVTFLSASLIPKKADVYVIAGGYVALKAVNSDVVQTTSDSMLKSIEGWLDKELARKKRANADKNTAEEN